MSDRKNRSNKEKLALERAAVQIFVSLYNVNRSPKLRLLYQQDKPDAVLQDANHNKLGLEITHVFYDAEEARRLLGRSDQKEQLPQSVNKWIAELNSLMKRKEQKIESYDQSFPVALLIRNSSPAIGMSQILNQKEQIYRSTNKFFKIWLLSRDSHQDWLLRELD